MIFLVNRFYLYVLLVVGVTLYFMGCASKDDAEKAKIKTMTNEEQIESVLKAAFEDTYDRNSDANLELAGRVEGASAWVKAGDNASFSIPKDKTEEENTESEKSAEEKKKEKAAKEAAKEAKVKTATSGDGALSAVKIKIALKGFDEAITAVGNGIKIKELVELKNLPDVSTRYQILAMCYTAGCRHLVVMLREEDADKSNLIRETAMIFKFPKEENDREKKTLIGTTVALPVFWAATSQKGVLIGTKPETFSKVKAAREKAGSEITDVDQEKDNDFDQPHRINSEQKGSGKVRALKDRPEYQALRRKMDKGEPLSKKDRERLEELLAGKSEDD